MRFYAVVALGLAAFALARPAAEGEEKRDLAAALPDPIQGNDEIIVLDEPTDIVARHAAAAAAANNTAATGDGKKAKSS